MGIPVFQRMPRKVKKIIIRKTQKQQKQQQPKQQAKQKPRKQNAVARGLLGVVSGGADLLMPGTGRLVNVLGKKILNQLGLSEKIVLPPEYGGGRGNTQLDAMDGGSIVESADAPVQFGRDQLQTSFMRYLHKADNGDVIIHSRESARDIVTNAALNTQTVTTDSLYPHTAVLSVLKQVAANYAWYRILAVKVHYVHWAPTSTQARIAIAHLPTSSFNNAVALTYAQFSRLESFASGSAYEDFGLEFCPVADRNWYYSFPTLATIGGQLDQGAISVAVDLNNVTSATVGTTFWEIITAFREQRPPNVTVGLTVGLTNLLPKRIALSALAKVYQTYDDSAAEKLLSTIDLYQLADAIGQIRREGIRYSDEFEKVFALLHGSQKPEREPIKSPQMVLVNYDTRTDTRYPAHT